LVFNGTVLETYSLVNCTGSQTKNTPLLGRKKADNFGTNLFTSLTFQINNFK
jgi:hypothetical protein